MDKEKFQLAIEHQIAGDMETIDGPAQFAIIVPVIPIDEDVVVTEAVAPLRSAMEKALLEKGLLFRGIGIKVMTGRIPEKMKMDLLHLKTDHAEELVERMGKKSRVRRLREAWKSK